MNIKKLTAAVDKRLANRPLKLGDKVKVAKGQGTLLEGHTGVVITVYPGRLKGFYRVDLPETKSAWDVDGKWLELI